MGRYRNTNDERRGGEKMKFICFSDYSKEDVEKSLEAVAKIRALREKEPNALPKLLPGSWHMLAGDIPKLTKEYKGFALFEAESVEQLSQFVLMYNSVPSMSNYFVPIIESEKAIGLYLKSKK